MMRRYLPFMGVVWAYVFLMANYAVHTPAWQVPDEPAHYNYIRQLSAGALPVIRHGDWDSAYQGLLLSSGFDPRHTAQIERIEYEDHQPPLYYLLLTPIYWLSAGNLTTLRLVSGLLGGVALACLYALGRLLAPRQPLVALAVTGFSAFLPQNLALMGGVNNDALAQALAALLFLLIARYLRAPRPTWGATLWLASTVGLALLTKTTLYFLAGLAGLAILLRWRRAGGHWKTAAGHILLFGLLAGAMGGLWWGRSLLVYGGTDFLGLQTHDEVAAGQLQTSDYIQQTLGGDRTAYWRNLATTTFHSFWGQFGWMAVPMPLFVYRLLGLACVSVLLGVMWLAFKRPYLATWQVEMLSLCALGLLLVAAAFLLYNSQFVQFQGRYLYPALAPLGLLFGAGLLGWGAFLGRVWSPLRWLPLLSLLMLAGLAAYALQTYLIPNLPRWD